MEFVKAWKANRCDVDEIILLHDSLENICADTFNPCMDEFPEDTTVEEAIQSYARDYLSGWIRVGDEDFLNPPTPEEHKMIDKLKDLNPDFGSEYAYAGRDTAVLIFDNALKYLGIDRMVDIAQEYLNGEEFYLR